MKLNKDDSNKKGIINPNVDIIGPRKLHRFQGKKQEVFDSVAINFVSKLQASFDGFKEYCNLIENSDNDCAILDTDWTDFGEIQE